MSEQLEIVDIENEEYPQIFHQIRELRVFRILRLALQQSNLRNRISNELSQIKILTGMHDDELHTIYEIQNDGKLSTK